MKQLVKITGVIAVAMFISACGSTPKKSSAPKTTYKPRPARKKTMDDYVADLKSNNSATRLAASNKLATMGTPAAKKVIVLYAHPNVNVHRQAVKCLVKMKKPATSVISDTLSKSSVKQVKMLCCMSLTLMGSPAGDEAFVNLLVAMSDKDKEVAAQAKLAAKIIMAGMSKKK
ncbi:MAG: HEAT repeat domain-containing protein [Planctomycetota bacterium]|nr:HEAT repeat domain-containing protein [Planctomycetota bacterium]